MLWLGVVLIAPSDWAKRHVVAALEARSGRSVGLERLSVRLLGGIELTNLEIGSPQSTDDPWLKTASVVFDFNPMRLLAGKVGPTTLAIEGVSLRVLRRADGTLELADLIAAPPKPINRDGRHRGMDLLAVRFRGGTVTLIDEPSHTRLHLQHVEGEGSYEAERICIHQMRGVLNGGTFRLVGQLDRSPAGPVVKAHFRAGDVVLDDGMSVLRYAVPVLAGASLNLKGHLDTDVY